MTLRDRIQIAAAQADGKLSEDPLDRELGWIFFHEFCKIVNRENLLKRDLR